MITKQLAKEIANEKLKSKDEGINQGYAKALNDVLRRAEMDATLLDDIIDFCKQSLKELEK